MAARQTLGEVVRISPSDERRTPDFRRGTLRGQLERPGRRTPEEKTLSALSE